MLETSHKNGIQLKFIPDFVHFHSPLFTLALGVSISFDRVPFFFFFNLILSFFFLAWFFGLFGLFEALTIRILHFTFWFCLHSNQRLDLRSHPFKAFLFYKLLLTPLTSLLQWYVISQPRIHDIHSWLT